MTYAKNTNVSIDRSEQEIRKLLHKYGATEFGNAYRSNKAAVMFSMANRRIKFVLNFPIETDREFTHSPRGKRRSSRQVQQFHEQAVKAKWRALLLVIKAKLEAVTSNIASFEEEFLPYIVLPSGKTVAEETLPIIEEQYRSGKVGPLLLE